MYLKGYNNIMKKLKVLSYNIHKGVNILGNKMTLDQIRDAIRSVNADLVFLQEVQAQSFKKSSKFEEWPSGDVYEYLADTIWTYYSYAKNSVYDDGHHGNVILSKFPINTWFQKDISTNRMESRGLLGCEINLCPEDESEKSIFLFCVHLNLLHGGRLNQYEKLFELIRLHAKEDPFILAGDFNDWNKRASEYLANPLGLIESHKICHGEYAKSFPAQYPFLCLDRMYSRGFKVLSCNVLRGSPWKTLSDHAPLLTEYILEE